MAPVRLASGTALAAEAGDWSRNPRTVELGSGVAMLTFSQHGPEAEKQMRAVIFYLTTFGYIDGDFDEAEKEYVRDYVKRLVAHRVDSAVDAAEVQLRQELTGKYTAHFLEVFELWRTLRTLESISVSRLLQINAKRPHCDTNRRS